MSLPFPSCSAPEKLNTDLSTRLRQVMATQFCSVADLAERSGLDIETVTEIYSGSHKILASELLVLAEALDVHILALVEGIATPGKIIPACLMDPSTGTLAVEIASLDPASRDAIRKQVELAHVS